MPHSRFQRGLDNGHIRQEMQRPIPAPRQAIVCVGFLTWSINWTVSGGEITRIGWQRKVMKRTTCSPIQRFVAKNGKIAHNWMLLLVLSLIVIICIFHLHFIAKNEGILSVVQVVQILRAPWIPRLKMKLGSRTLIHWQITTFPISLKIVV